MDLTGNFISDFMQLPEIFNALAEQQGSFNYYKVFYNASVRAPYSEKYLSQTPLKGYHFKLDIILEPISEEAEVLNNIVSFMIEETYVREVKFFKDGNETVIDDFDFNDESASTFLAKLEKFCQESLSV